MDEAASVEGARMQAALERRLFDASPPPVRVGRFVLVDVLGRGGMGIVYRAFDPELDRVVALKLLDARGPAGEARLLREARTLARLNHPHVVALYEVGRHGPRLFLAMEYVDGGSLARWCAAGEPGEPARTVRALDLFEQAARGLIAAHAAGVVHRDLKPGNILVGSDGRARLVDFGLARADLEPSPFASPDPASPFADVSPDPASTPADASSTPASPASTPARPFASAGPDPASTPASPTSTPASPFASDPGLSPSAGPSTAKVVGTPGYMAPEQRRGLADARSDQFSLCVTFFEALYGVRPAVADGDDPAAVERLVAARGRHVPAGVRELLARGLAPDPGDRFPSVAALLAALVRARRRRRWPAAVALATAAALAWGLLAGEAAPPCAPDEAAIEAAWGEDRRAAVRQAIRASGAAYAASTWDRVERALGRAAARWQADDLAACKLARAPDPEAAAVGAARLACSRRAAQTLALTTAALADPAIGPARAIHVALALPDLLDCRAPAPSASPEALRLAQTLDRARLAEQLRQFDETLARARAVLGATGPGELPHLRAAAHALIARVHGLRGDMAAKLTYEREALREAERADAPEELATAWSELAALAARSGDPDLARFYLERARAFERDGRLDARARARLGWKAGLVYHWTAQHDEAVREFEQAAEQYRAAAPGSLELATVLADLAEARAFTGPPEAALAAGEEALALLAEHLGPDHPETAVERMRTARLYSFVQDEARVEAELLAALVVLEQNPEFMPEARAAALDELAQTRDNLGRPHEALRDIDRALALTTELHGPGSPQRVMQLTTRGRLLLHIGDLAGAAAELGRALPLARASASYADLLVVEIQLHHADVLAGLGRADEARLALAEVRARLDRAYAPTSDPGLQARGFIGRVEVSLGDLAEAQATLSAAIDDAEAVGAAVWVGRLRFEQARGLAAGGDPEAARAAAEAARAALVAARVPDAALADVDALLGEL